MNRGWGGRLAAAGLVVWCAGCGALMALPGCKGGRKGEVAMRAEPVTGWSGTKNVSRAGGFTFAGQPTERAIEEFAGKSGSVVIDLRTHVDGDRAEFDEKAKVEGLGMRYVHLPMKPGTFSNEDVERFAAEADQAVGPVLVHCGTSNRVGGLWAAYLALQKGVPVEDAMEAGRSAGMSSESMEEAARRVIGGK